MRAASKYTRDYYLRSKIRKILFWVISVTLAILLAYAYSYYFGQNIVVQESSMDPTLSAGDTLLVDRAAYKLDLRNEEILLCSAPATIPNLVCASSAWSDFRVKPFRSRTDRSSLTGKLMWKKEIFRLSQIQVLPREPVYLGRGEYFVLGDNRNNSEDSRYADIGPVEKKRIVGKLWMVTAPFDKFGLLHH